MTTTLLISNNGDEITSLMNKKFLPRLKTEENSIYYTSNNDISISEKTTQNNINGNNTLNKMSYLFPSIPLEVSKIIIYIIFIVCRKLRIYSKITKIYP